MAKKKHNKSKTKAEAKYDSKAKKSSASQMEMDTTETPMEASADETTETVFQESLNTEAANDTAETTAEFKEDLHETENGSKKIHIEFYGSEILRQKAPQAFELAEAVAEEWVKDGNFQKLPLQSPLAQLVATVGLQSAKKIEKKLEEKGVITMAKMGFEYAKTKWPLKNEKNEQQA